MTGVQTCALPICPRMASSVVENLSRWQDWESLDRLIASYGMPPFDTSLTKQKVVIFALVCVKDGKKTSPDMLPPSAIAARKFLDGLDPEVVKSAEISLKRGGR